MAKRKLRDLLDTEDLSPIKFKNATVSPKQTKYHPCHHWHEEKCNCPDTTIRKKEETIVNKEEETLEKAKSSSKGIIWAGERACKGIKKTCSEYDFAEGYVPQIDAKYILQEDEAETIAFALENDDNLLITGPPGCGKSSHVLQMLAILNWEVNRFSCSEETSNSRIIGQWVIQGSEMVWIDGHVTDAMRNGKVLLEEEADFMRPELRGELHTVMEKGGTLELHTHHPKTGRLFRETINKHEDFRWVSTANTIGLGDDKFLYHGTTMQNAASRDRYEVILTMDYPAPGVEVDIITTKVPKISKEIANRMVEVANAIRIAFKNGTCNFPFTIRRTISWAKYYIRKEPTAGTKLAILNFASVQDQLTICGIIETHMALKIH